MSTYRKLLFASEFALAVTCLLIALNASHGDGQEPREPNPPGFQADPANSPVILNFTEQAGKESPPKIGGKSGKENPKTTKNLSMAEAVVIAERIGKGYVLKAERKDKSDLYFKFDVLSRDGQKLKIELNADGTLRTKVEPKLKKDEPDKKKTEKKPAQDKGR